MRATKLPPTPLQRVIGFKVAEEIYDELPLSYQLIIDLRIDGCTFHEIAFALDMPYSTVYESFIKSRIYLAKMKLELENRIAYKEDHPVINDTYIEH